MDKEIQRAYNALKYGPETRSAFRRYEDIHQYSSRNEFVELVSKPYSSLKPAQRNKLKLKFLIEFGGSCEICGETEKESGRVLIIDHDHITDRARGLLCQNCNSMIGFADCDVCHTDHLRLAINYLERKEGGIVPP